MLSFLELMERVQAFRDAMLQQGFDVLLNIDQNYDSSVKVHIEIETRPPVEEAAGDGDLRDIPY